MNYFITHGEKKSQPIPAVSFPEAIKFSEARAFSQLSPKLELYYNLNNHLMEGEVSCPENNGSPFLLHKQM